VSPKVKVALNIVKYLIGSLVLLFLLLVAAVNLPFVHTLITKKTNTILAEKGLPIHVGKITLLLNGKIGLDQLEIIRSDTDTILFAGKASVEMRPLQLLKKQGYIVKGVL